MAANQESYPQFGPFPEYVCISQYSDIKIQPFSPGDRHKKAELAGEISRQWRLDDSGLYPCKEIDKRPRKKTLSTVFHSCGLVCFAISPDRKLVVISSVYGHSGEGR